MVMRKMIGFIEPRFKEFRRLKLEYMQADKNACMSDSEYVLICSRIVSKMIEARNQQRSSDR